MNFAQIARELRNEKNLSQMELSKFLGISAAAIGHLELAKREPGSNTLIAYAKYFEVSIDYLLGLENDYGARVSSTAAPIGDGYSIEEREIIEKYRGLPDKLKKLVRDQIEVLSTPEELLPKTEKKV